MTGNRFLQHARARWSWLHNNLAWLLMATTLALFATETLFNVPFWLMAVAGLYLSVKAPRALWREPVLRLAGLLFLCIWLPQLLALPDAANLGRSLETVIAYPHFYFAGVYMLRALQDRQTRHRLEMAISIIVTVWIADALVQYVAGADLFGYPYRPGQLTGMFYPKISLGHLLAVLAPVYFETVRQRCGGRPWLWLLAALVLLTVVLLSGRRVAWLMTGISFAGYILYLYRINAMSLRTIALVFAIGVLGGGAVLATNPAVARRTAVLLGLFSGNAKDMDQATSHRLPLWGTALHIASSHWINGVGPRGYRYVFREYAGDDNFYLRNGGDGQTHPHQLVLEVATETGAIGLSGLICFWWLFVTAGWRRLQATLDGAPWLIAGLVAWWPLNAHMAFYGSYWSSVSWWVLLLLLAPRGASAPEPSCARS